jgi:acyl-CoA synthetase (NDP forming)
MDIHNLNHIFNHQRIALIGITPNSKIVGGKIYSNLVGGCFRGVAQITPENPRMIAVFRRHGFEIKLDPTGSVVEVVKTLRG